MVQLMSQLESRQVTMPPVTTLPESGSRLQIFWIASRICLLAVSTVQDSQLVSLMSLKNFSGWPNAGSCAASFFHISTDGPSPFFTFTTGAWVLSP